MNCDFDSLARDEHRWRASGASVVAAVAAGGVIGAEARYGATVLWPGRPGGFPYTTFAVNVLGCALIGVAMVVISEMASPSRLLRPFLATGVLGGFTTFSTFCVDAQQLTLGGHTTTALVSLAATPAAALAAVAVTTKATRSVLSGRKGPT
jgi:CrcB protein